MTENEKRKEGDYLMTCFVIHVSLLSLHIFFRNSSFTKKACRLTATYNFELGFSCFSINEVLGSRHRSGKGYGEDRYSDDLQ